jgi:release factor glutamine methyltransferase
LTRDPSGDPGAPFGTLADLARSTVGQLAGAGIEPAEARLDAELLVRSVLGWSKAQWLTGSASAVPPGIAEAVGVLARRRASREPMAYILGRREFWGLEFEVTPAVLVPRPETEIVVEQALRRLPQDQGRTVVDVGTGSGCLAVSLAVERPDLRIAATDVSAAALAVARRNAALHGVRDRIQFHQASLLQPIGPGAADLIVSNPPYVPAGDRDTLQPEVGRFEPAEALFAGADGLSMIRALIVESAPRLAAGGWLIFELGAGQAGAVRNLLDVSGAWRSVEIVADLQGIARVVVAQRK